MLSAEIESERERRKQIHTFFHRVDIISAVLILSIDAIIQSMLYPYVHKKLAGARRIYFAITIYTPTLDAIFSLVLAISAFYLVKSIRKTTRRSSQSRSIVVKMIFFWGV